MTERGQRLYTRAIRVSGIDAGADGCVDAVEGAIASEEVEAKGYPPADRVKPADVSIGASQLPGARPGVDPETGLAVSERYAEVSCHYRGSIGVERIGEDWRVFVPFCFD